MNCILSYCSRILLVFCLTIISNIHAQIGKSEKLPQKKLLFLPFFNEAADTNFTWLEESIGNAVDEVAKKKFTYDRISDFDFSTYFINHGLQRKDLFDIKKVQKIGKGLSADGIIFGTFKPDKERGGVVVTGKILSVIDKEIIAEKTVVMPISSEMFGAVEEISVPLGENIKNLFFPTDRGAMVRAATLPGWGHQYKQRSNWAYAWGGVFWTAVGFTAFSTFQLIRYKIQNANYSPDSYVSANGGVGFRDPAAAQAGFDDYANKINTWGQLSLIGIISTVVIYAGNIIHAYYITPDVVTTPDLMGDQKQAKLRFNFYAIRNESIAALSYEMHF